MYVNILISIYCIGVLFECHMGYWHMVEHWNPC